VEHELSSRSSFYGREDDPRLEAHILEILDDHEFQTISHRPTIVHATLVGAIRRASSFHDLDANGMNVIALVLHDVGLLTVEEARWLGDAGTPWARTDER
jgi:hypothetical protein